MCITNILITIIILSTVLSVNFNTIADAIKEMPYYKFTSKWKNLTVSYILFIYKLLLY